MAQGKYVKRRKRRSGINGMAILLAAMLLILGSMLLLKSCIQDEKPPVGNESPSGETENNNAFWNPFKDPTESTTLPTTEATTVPTEPYIVATASVGAGGDVLVHGPIITAAEKNGEYDFSNIYTYATEYFNRYDYMVANLEVTLGGDSEPYQGYPTFNCPDAMATALKNAGVDMLLTANNHSYDMGYNGMMRTLQVLDEMEIDRLGSRRTEDEPVYQVKDINGIKIGMVCYTYDTRSETEGAKSLNGIIIKKDARALINTFDYSNPSGSYEEFEEIIADMKQDGAEAIVFFVHWGYEYHLSPISYQKNMAQKLCDLGVDVIIGGHPHVLEPFDTLTSDSGNTTYCLYSTGNLISNQRRETLNTVDNENYTEDGIIFGVTFQKWNDGTVEVCNLEATPTWVSKERRDGRNRYTIVPLDINIADWDNSFDLLNTSYLEGSYKRTMSIVGEGLNAAREKLGLPAYPLTLDEE